MLSKMSNPLGDKLYDAARNDQFELVKSIINAERFNPEFDINYQAFNGNTALWIACSWGFKPTKYRASTFYEIVKFLIEHGADVNIANNEGKTPLYIAASWGHHHIVQLLILHGAELNVQTGNLTPLMIAVYSTRVSNPLGDYKPYSKHHMYYVAKDYMEQIRKTGEYLRLFPELDKDYKMLITHQAIDPWEPIPNEIMSIIVKYNHFATVKELVHGGCNLNIPDKEGNNIALEKAKQLNHKAMMQLMEENGALWKVPVNNIPDIKEEMDQST